MQNSKKAIPRNQYGIIIFLAALTVAVFFIWQIRQTSAMQDVPAAGGGPAPIGQKGNWKLIFTDDFDSQTLDVNKWTTCYWWNNQGCTNEGNRNLNWYRSENVVLKDGGLHLTARQEQHQASDGKTYEYTSGMVTTGREVDNTSTPARFAFQYGFVEVRAKVPKGQGFWPAIWLLPADHISKPEIDIMEVLGHETDLVNMNFHYLDAAGERARSQGEWKGEDLAGAWHTFAVDWQPDHITWYVDGVARRTYTEAAHIPSEPMYLIINLAVGGEWPGPPNAETVFPNQFEIDYVRVWKQSGAVGLSPVADTFVNAEKADENFGKMSRLEVDGSPLSYTYLKFDLKRLAGKKIASAWLRLHTTGDGNSGSANSQAVFLTDSNWSETKMTFQNRPGEQGYIIGMLNKSEQNVAYDIFLESSVIQKYTGGKISFVLIGRGHDGVILYAREFRPLSPELMLIFDETSNAGE